MDWTDDWRWLALGLVGNAAFFSRFLVQWVASERAGRSYVPTIFWHLSLVGSALLLAYALHRRDPVFVLAYLPNGFVYLRNLALVRRATALEGGDRSAADPPADAPTSSPWTRPTR
jgi:lipid-A-disaccharide synthase-like uncharacterized protein